MKRISTENVPKPSSSSNQTSEYRPDDEADFVVGVNNKFQNTHFPIKEI